MTSSEPDYVYEGPISKQGHIHKYHRLGREHVFCGGDPILCTIGSKAQVGEQQAKPSAGDGAGGAGRGAFGNTKPECLEVGEGTGGESSLGEVESGPEPDQTDPRNREELPGNSPALHCLRNALCFPAHAGGGLTQGDIWAGSCVHGRLQRLRHRICDWPAFLDNQT